MCPRPLCLLCLVSTALPAMLFSACSSAPKNDHFLHKIIVNNIHFRRPAGPGADPSGGPGGTDYRSDPAPDARLDCRPAAELFNGIDIKAVRECLSDKTTATPVSYRLRREAVPKLVLNVDEPEKVSLCVYKTLPEIPVPREIFFETNEYGQMLCYSARLDIEADELAGAKMPMAKIDVTIPLPLKRPPKDDAETVRLLQSWALTPLWGAGRDGKPELKSKIVTKQLCKKCIGEKNLMQRESVPAYWP